jgi:hypothetical protein
MQPQRDIKGGTISRRFGVVNKATKIKKIQANRAFGTDSCHEVFFCCFTKLDLLS